MSDDNPCDGCGLCCMHMGSPPYDEEEREWLREDNPQAYADLLAVLETRELQLKTTAVDFVPCGFFDSVTRKCIHHDNKPDICRRFEIGDTYCNGFRAEAGLQVIDMLKEAHGDD